MGGVESKTGLQTVDAMISETEKHVAEFESQKEMFAAQIAKAQSEVQALQDEGKTEEAAAANERVKILQQAASQLEALAATMKKQQNVLEGVSLPKESPDPPAPAPAASAS